MRKLFVFIVLIFVTNALHAHIIHRCAINNDVAGILKWHRYKDQVDECGYKPIHYAAQCDQLKALQTLTEIKADIDSVTLSEGATALHLGAQFGGIGIISCLLLKRANINAQDKIASATPIHYAIYANNITAFRILLRCNQLRLDVVDKYGRTALHWAVMNGRPLMVQELLDYMQANQIQDTSDLSGYTALQMAQGYLEDMEPYIEQDAICRDRYIDFTNICNLFKTEDISEQDLQTSSLPVKHKKKLKKPLNLKTANESSTYAQSDEVKPIVVQASTLNTKNQYDYLGAIKRGMQQQSKKDAAQEQGESDSTSEASLSTSLQGQTSSSSSSDSVYPGLTAVAQGLWRTRPARQTTTDNSISAVRQSAQNQVDIEESQEHKEYEWQMAVKRRNKQRAQLFIAASSIETEPQQEDEQKSDTVVQAIPVVLQTEEEAQDETASTAVVKKKKNKKKKTKKEDDFDDIIQEFSETAISEPVEQVATSISKNHNYNEFIKAIKLGRFSRVMQLGEANSELLYTKDESDRLPIHYAVSVRSDKEDNLKIIEYLLAKAPETFEMQDKNNISAYDLLINSSNQFLLMHVVVKIRTNYRSIFQTLQYILPKILKHCEDGVENNHRLTKEYTRIILIIKMDEEMFAKI